MKQRVVEQFVLLNEALVDQIADKLNYKVLIKLVVITIPLNIKYFENFPIGHPYAILVYLTADMRKQYYQGILKLDQVFVNSQNISYVVLHLETDGIRGRYFDDFNELEAYYEDLRDQNTSIDCHMFTVYEGSQAENKDDSKFRNSLKKVLPKPFNLIGSAWKLFLDKWNSMDFIHYLKSNLGS